MIKINLLELIKNFKSYSFNNNIYVPKNYEVNKEMECLLVNDDEILENAITYDNIIYKYLVNIDVIYSTSDNLHQQKKNPSEEDYLNAFKFYIENDAFIDLEHNTKE